MLLDISLKYFPPPQAKKLDVVCWNLVEILIKICSYGYTLNFNLEFFFERVNFMVLQFFWKYFWTIYRMSDSEKPETMWFPCSGAKSAETVVPGSPSTNNLALPTMKASSTSLQAGSLGAWEGPGISQQDRAPQVTILGMNWSWGSERDPTSLWLRASFFPSFCGILQFEEFPSVVYSTDNQDHQQCTPNPSTDSLLGRGKEVEFLYSCILEF